MTEMMDIDALLPDMMMHVPTCPDPTAQNYMLKTVRDFLNRTRMWREYIEIDVSTPTFNVSLPIDDAELVSSSAIMNARFDEAELEPVTLDYLDGRFANWQSTDEVNTPRFITQMVPRSLIVYPAPAASGKLKVRCALRPALGSTDVPAFLEQYSEQLGRSAAGKAMLLPNQEFTNPQAAIAYRADFDLFVARQRIAAEKGQQGARLRTKGSFF